MMKKLKDLPRPPMDNGRGLHWSPVQGSQGLENWDVWSKRLLDCKIKWVLLTSGSDQITDMTCKRLISLGIMPIVRYIDKLSPSGNNGMKGGMKATVERLIKIGVKYHLRINEPDSPKAEWETSTHPRDWADIAADAIMGDCRDIQALGGIPLATVFENGDYHRQVDVFDLFHERGLNEVMEKGLVFSIHNYAKGRPASWPNWERRRYVSPWTREEYLNQKQPARWDEAKTINDLWDNQSLESINAAQAAQADPNVSVMQDRTCFRMFDYVNGRLEQLGYSPDQYAISGTEAGIEVDDRVDVKWMPNPTAITASEEEMIMYRFTQRSHPITLSVGDHETQEYMCPENYLCSMKWLAGQTSFGVAGQWEQGAIWSDWHNVKYDLQGELPVVQMLKDEPSVVRSEVDPSGVDIDDWANVPASPPYVAEFDSTLNYLHPPVSVTPVDAAGWHLTSITRSEADNANGYIYVKLIDESGTPLHTEAMQGNDVPRVAIERPDATDYILTKGEADKFNGNYYMSGALLGTYKVYVAQEGAQSDVAINLGIGTEELGQDGKPLWKNTDFFLTFQKSTQARDLTKASAAVSPPEVVETTPVKAETPPPTPPTEMINQPPQEVPATPDVSSPPQPEVTPAETSQPQTVEPTVIPETQTTVTSQETNAMTWFQPYIDRAIKEYQGTPRFPQYPYQYPVLEITHTAAEVQPGQDVWRLILVHHLTGDENNPGREYGKGNHALFVQAVDEQGNRINGVGFHADSIWIDDQRKRKNEEPGFTSKGVTPMDKGTNEPAGNMPIWGNERIDARIDDGAGTPSDIAENFQTVWPDDAAGQNTVAHHSFLAVFMKTKAGATTPSTPPTAISTPADTPVSVEQGEDGKDWIKITDDLMISRELAEKIAKAIS